MSTPDPPVQSLRALTWAMFAASFSLILFELLLTRLFSVVLFAQFAHLALALALLGISVGAVVQHLWPSLLPDEGLEGRLAWVLLAQGALTLIAIVCTVWFPVTEQFEVPPLTYQERSTIRNDLLDPLWFGALLPILMSPFAAAGLAFAGAFQRRREHIGRLYGADLLGGAVGAVVFLPALRWLAGPDVAFVLCASTGAAAAGLFLATGARRPAWLAGGFALAGLLLAGLGATGTDLLKVRYAAGYSEENITYQRWTPLTRLSIHEDRARGAYMLLDNSSASQICTDERCLRQLATTAANRSVAFRLHEPPARIAILAASAGPEVGVAQYWGHHDIDAIDIAGDIFDIVATQYPTSPVNPYLDPGTRRVTSDGRAAILHATEPYDVILMVHANLWSSAGLLSSAWSPSLLETKEAFHTYLDKLSPDGTISFGRGSQTGPIVRSAARALQERGVEEPYRHILYFKSDSWVLLVKPRPWTQEERDEVVRILADYKQAKLLVDPLGQPTKQVRKILWDGPVMTDDRPYLDSPHIVSEHLRRALTRVRGGSTEPLAALYESFVIQCLFVLVAGGLFIGLPLFRRGPTQLSGVRGVGGGLLYVACLGYGYLAVETILVHELVLFVGHPTYAVTVVILSMLTFSGLGSLVADRLAADRLLPSLRAALVGVLLLGALQGYAVPEVLHAFALGWPLTVRLALTFAVLAPLGLLMGMPFPLAMRLLRPEAGGMVPWAWALNGWTSVVASLATVLLSRMYGYSYAFTAALAAYLLALALAGLLPRIGAPTTHPEAATPS